MTSMKKKRKKLRLTPLYRLKVKAKRRVKKKRRNQRKSEKLIKEIKCTPGYLGLVIEAKSKSKMISRISRKNLTQLYRI